MFSPLSKFTKALVGNIFSIKLYKNKPRNFVLKRNFSRINDQFNDSERLKALSVINDLDENLASKYSVTKKRFNNLIEWRREHGLFNDINQLKYVEGFTERITIKLIDNIINGGKEQIPKIKGQIVYPYLDDDVITNAETIVSIQLSTTSIAWSQISKSDYSLVEWGCHSVKVEDAKKLLMNNLYDIAYQLYRKVPEGSIYIIEAPVTMLRATGSDPQNPKVLTVNLQKCQVTSMLVALLNGLRVEHNRFDDEQSKQVIYYLRQALSARLFRTLIGNERVTAENAVSEILSKTSDLVKLNVSEEWIQYYNSRRDLEKETIGQALLLCLTFMELCIFKNINSIKKLTSFNAPT